MDRFFSVGLDEQTAHATAETARAAAESALDDARDDDGGWLEETTRIGWGVFLGHVVETSKLSLVEAVAAGDEDSAETMRAHGWDYIATHDLIENTALLDVIAFRQRRRATEGDAFDDTLTDASLPRAVRAVLAGDGTDPRERLVLCAGLLLAEIDRLDRAAAR